MSYAKAIAGIGVVPIIQKNIGYYQGDWVAVVKDTDRWPSSLGFLCYGYGSCSGCDEWEGADNAIERAEIVVRMAKSIRWFEKPADLKAWLNSDDRREDLYIYHDDEWREFVDSVLAVSDKELEQMRND
ncbi:hypothetical protein [Mycobacteroides abscessus]|uniref:hypothetical protein n=1 Tax=Mycobacteroides abscessus TaxID=36809 RepID=UPI001056EA42|nr:hypothetical protein [Mycobacteroides abscessus]